MIFYVKGFVFETGLDYVIVDNNGIGYHIVMSKTDGILLNEEVLIYTYQHVREDDITLFGFENTESRDMFLKLISVKGVGPKTANNILSKTNANELVKAIESNDVDFLKTLPGIGAKSAKQIILDLQNKLSTDTIIVTNEQLEDAIEGLKGLGYSSSELKSIKKQLSTKVMDASEYLKAGLIILNKRKGG